MSDYNNEQLGIEPAPNLKVELWRDALGWAKTILFAVVFALLINNFIIVNASVPTGSMEGTIRVNDRIVAFRLAYLFSEPSRFDIVVFRGPEDSSILYVKRIIGLPGERINIVDGRVYVNDEPVPLRYDFVQGNVFGNFGPYPDVPDGHVGDYPVIPEGHFFVLGDNRGNSVDSRHWNDNRFVSEDDILGRVIFRYFPGFQSLTNT